PRWAWVRAGGWGWDRRSAGGLVGVARAAPPGVTPNRHAGDFVSAERLYRATLARNPNATMARNNLAMILAADGRSREARDEFMAALRIDPTVAETQMNVGRLLVEEDALPEAGAPPRQGDPPRSP